MEHVKGSRDKMSAEGSEAFNEQLLKEVAVKREKANGSGSQ